MEIFVPQILHDCLPCMFYISCKIAKIAVAKRQVGQFKELRIHLIPIIQCIFLPLTMHFEIEFHGVFASVEVYISKKIMLFVQTQKASFVELQTLKRKTV